jgi:hypothetical protein
MFDADEPEEEQHPHDDEKQTADGARGQGSNLNA